MDGWMDGWMDGSIQGDHSDQSGNIAVKCDSIRVTIW